MRFNSIWILLMVLVASCKKTDRLVDFTEADEIALGEKLSNAILNDPDYSVIPSEGNTIPYGYVNSLLSEITATSVITKGEAFTWTIYLLDDDTRQAFALPGGHIFVSTGMIFFLDNEDQFSGLIAHLVAHINQSHITEALFFKYGVNGLKGIASSGDATELKSIISDLDLTDDFLIFTRGNELEADSLAISMLSETNQSCDSEKLFYFKILNVQSNQQSGFITAHQLDESRIENISEFVSTNGCDTTVDSGSTSRFRSFRNSLP